MQDGERYLTLNGIRHWCRVDGAGRSEVPIVALHGGPGGNHYVFERTVVRRDVKDVVGVSVAHRRCVG